MIEKIRNYFIDNEITDKNTRLNVDFLGETPTEFSLLKVRVNPILENFVDGTSLRQFQFQLLSCNDYGAEVVQNLPNSEFYDLFYETIEELNDKEILPDIEGIESIECLDNGAILNSTTKTARYSILMRITYLKNRKER